MHKYSESIFISDTPSNICVLICILTLLLGLLYGQFLSNPLVFDDIQFFIVGKNGVQPMESYHFQVFQMRSLPYATLAWTQAYIGQNILPHRIISLLLHLFVTLSLFAFLTTIFSTVIGFGAGYARGMSHTVAAFFAALLFALHPVATYAAGYLVQRTIVMATLFSLLTLWFYLKGSVLHKPLWLWAAVPLYYLAVQSKEHAIMLPAVLLAMTVLLHKDWVTKIKQRWVLFLALALIAGFVLLARKGLLGSIYEPVAAEMLSEPEKANAYPLSVLTQCWLFFKYAFFWAFPKPTWMSIDMREPLAPSFLSMYGLALGTYLAWGCLSVFLIFKRGKLGLLGFSMFFPWVMFFTEFSSVRLQEIFVLYRSYIWAVGAFCVLPILFLKIEARLAALILSIIAAAMFVVSMERLIVLSNPLFVWTDAEKLVNGREDLPGAYRIYYNRGTERAGFGMLDAAIEDYNLAIKLNPNFAESFGNLGAAYAQLENWDKALVALTQAITITKNNGRTYQIAHGNLGTVYLRKGDFVNAISEFTTALSIGKYDGKNINPSYIYGRAQAHEKLGDLQSSRADYRISCDLAKIGCEKLLQE